MTHAVVAVALGTLAPLPTRRRAFWLLSALLPILPDFDVLGTALGVSFSSMWGHRGISHSLVGAAAIGFVAAMLARRRLGVALWPLATYFALITASHGVLDALTNGGPGVAFFAPFDDTRSFFPWRPIPVSPLASRFFSAWGWRVFSAELMLLWIPAAAVAVVGLTLRRR